MAFFFNDYLTNNPDVGKARTDPTHPYYKKDDIATSLQHYGEYGFNEGRDIGVPTGQLKSGALDYLSSNPDVSDWAKTTPEADWLDALTHYGRYGRSEGRPFDYNFAASGGQQAGSGGDEQGGFNIPTDAVPSSQSGVNWDTPVMKELLKALIPEISGMKGNIEEYGNVVDERYRGLLKEALSPEMLQGTMNELNRKNMLNSSVASDTMSKVTSDVINKLLGQSQDTQMMVAGQKAEVPTRLANIATIGQESSQENKLAPYELIARILMNQ